ncbi:hypothetical protein [Flavimaricola marinus]|uniref:Uncharacterized protein n=1 Tax=Flavimaricola marinus TaxID=1819565 RepID=A0A238LL44_9RHOB|nr:hypothetical protein [Flavimaricola marinus]SMY10362.1 hypothetical protein LOM8899_04537 [Flavimaricola marinus]
MMHHGFFTLLMTAAVASASGTAAQQSSTIDEQLAQNIDLRDARFGACFRLPICEVDGLRILAWHRHSDWEDWHAAFLHWDPIDGIGVLEGGQDDEIDYNERIIIEFPHQQNVYGIWLSDLFINEGKHYAANATANETQVIADSAEIAGFEFRLNGNVERRLSVSGNLDLPDFSFNQRVAPDVFSEGGDLRQRLVFRDGEILVLSASLNSRGDRQLLSTVPVTELDPEKQGLFAGQDGVEYDISALMSDGLEFMLEDDNHRNIDRINAILEDQTMLMQISSEARIARTTGSIPNGEVLASWDEPVAATSVMFHALAGTSNDFSIAGIMISGASQ